MLNTATVGNEGTFRNAMTVSKLAEKNEHENLICVIIEFLCNECCILRCP